MTGPIDANIQARIDKAIDEKFFGMESLDVQRHIDILWHHAPLRNRH